MTTEQPEQHPDDAAVAEVRAWVDDARYDEELIELEARTLRRVLAVLDGWKQNAETAAAQREAAYGRLETARVDMRMLREGLDQQRNEDAVLANYRISAMVDPVEIDRPWVAVNHNQCDEFVFGDDPDDPDEVDAAELWARIAKHKCKPCECGCISGQPCGCGLEDCECLGGCPVCDADGTTYTIGEREPD